MDPSFRKKKHFGQHFLKDPSIAKKVADAIPANSEQHEVLELGPGIGALTDHLLERSDLYPWLVEVDPEAVEVLRSKYAGIKDRIIQKDFLELDFQSIAQGPLMIVGNFPYNISSPILVRMVENRSKVDLLVGMFQKEVAQRVCAEPGSKTYGRISVLVRTFYHAEYLFTVKPGVFSPPPKVDSAVIRLSRNSRSSLPCNEEHFFKVVKAAFGQRRKTLRNALKSVSKGKPLSDAIYDKRAEELDIEAFIRIASYLEE